MVAPPALCLQAAFLGRPRTEALLLRRTGGDQACQLTGGTFGDAPWTVCDRMRFGHETMNRTFYANLRRRLASERDAGATLLASAKCWSSGMGRSSRASRWRATAPPGSPARTSQAGLLAASAGDVFERSVWQPPSAR